METIQIDLASLPPRPPERDSEPPPEREEAVIPVNTPVPTPIPEAEPTPIPTPTSRPAPTATPRPPPTPTPKRRYLTPEEIRQRIQNQAPAPQPVAAAPTLSPSEIRDLIGSDLPTGTGIPSLGGPSGAGVDFGGVAQTLKNKLYSAWSQPRHLSSISGVSARTEVVVANDGRVLSTKFITRSGIQEFDRSVQSALSSVPFVDALPEEFDGESRSFEIEFELSQ